MRDFIQAFEGKDARDLDELASQLAEPADKRGGVPRNVHIATLELAVLDMLGNIANMPVGLLIGELLNPRVAIYLGTRLGELRRMEPEQSLELMKRDVDESQAKAVKIRGGAGDQLGLNRENAPGRTDRLIKKAREFFGDEMTLMMDGNGTYAYDEAVRIGRLMEEYNYYFYEEPVPWDWYDEQKRVAEAMTIPMAGGEAEFRERAFRWLIANDAFDIIQPDLLYYGGLIRSMRVARMAAAFGKPVMPHMSGGGLGYIYSLQFVSVCPNAGQYHEFKLSDTRDANGTDVPIVSKAEPIVCRGGVFNVPTGAGLGLTIDPDYIATHKVVESW
jgi:L-alanine-DL-glutamate epimerase-like enolase superfamily enzyme